MKPNIQMAFLAELALKNNNNMILSGTLHLQTGNKYYF